MLSNATSPAFLSCVTSLFNINANLNSFQLATLKISDWDRKQCSLSIFQKHIKTITPIPFAECHAMRDDKNADGAERGLCKSSGLKLGDLQLLFLQISILEKIMYSVYRLET